MIHVMVTTLVKVTVILETEVGRATVATLAMKMVTVIAMAMAMAMHHNVEVARTLMTLPVQPFLLP